jgi:hypothetical protein
MNWSTNLTDEDAWATSAYPSAPNIVVQLKERVFGSDSGEDINDRHSTRSGAEKVDLNYINRVKGFFNGDSIAAVRRSENDPDIVIGRLFGCELLSHVSSKFQIL